MPRIYITSVFVDDQDKAQRFYTEKLGFVTKHEIPLGEYRWLTLVGANEPDGPELLLEPAAHPACAPFTAALKADGIPYTSFEVEDLQAEYERLTAAGVVFTQAPTDVGEIWMAVFDDTCGNLVALAQPK